MPAIGTYATGRDFTSVEPDIYPATITFAEVVMDAAHPDLPATDKWGKNRLLIKVELDGLERADGGPIELRRQVAISYGATGGTYAALAQLIQAACGIACGNAAQRHVTTEQLVGKKLRVQTDNVEKDGTTYTNIITFFAPKKAAVRPAPIAAPPDYDLDEDEIPL